MQAARVLAVPALRSDVHVIELSDGGAEPLAIYHGGDARHDGTVGQLGRLGERMRAMVDCTAPFW